MTDFRQLALEYVLGDDEAKLTSIAQQAAKELETAQPATNPVARWVESVQPWMPSRNGDDEESQDLPDWTARAKALEFLSRTLDFLNSNVLKPSQVKLLVAFFGAMFDVDHKAGVMASATALSRIIAMKSFQAPSGLEILQKLCTLKDDFPRQIVKTRLAVYDLINSLITNKDVAKDLQAKQESSEYMLELLQLCRSERDPDCLIAWFGIMTVFMTTYNPSPGVLEEVYNAFKAYYPITLPRTAQSKVTPEELKSQLRSCFSCHSGLAKHAFPFLIGKLDQGDGVTVNVKIDVLRTLRACVEDYDEPQQSVVPYANRIWGSLKYEVRNGEIEDTMWSTLEVLKAVTTRLKGDDLRDYTLNVIRDCVSDLASAMYCGAAGRLILSVLSASSTSFVLMAASTITHIKENLRHPKSLTHSQDLLKLLRAILETRVLLMNVSLDASDESDFTMIDPIFKNLYSEVFKQLLEAAQKTNTSEDEVKVATEAVQGAAVLVCQKQTPKSEQGGVVSLLPESTSTEICESLLQIIMLGCEGHDSNMAGVDELVNETTNSLQRAIGAFPDGFQPSANRIIASIRSNTKSGSPDAAQLIQDIGPILAFIGCSELPSAPEQGLSQFLYSSRSLAVEIFAAVDAKADAKVLCALAASLQTVFRYFKDACLKSNPKKDGVFSKENWITDITGKYPLLSDIGSGDVVLTDAAVPKTLTASEVFNDFLLSSLFIVKAMYLKVTTLDTVPVLSGSSAGNDRANEQQFLYLLSTLAGFAVHELTEAQQVAIGSEAWGINLFHDDFTSTQETTGDWIISSRVNILSFGIIEALRPAAVAKLYDAGIAQIILTKGTTATVQDNPAVTAVSRSILSVLANKYKLETVEPVITSLEQQLSTAVSHLSNSAEQQAATHQIISILAVTAGLFRRYSGKNTQGLMKLIRELPSTGLSLARKLEVIAAPQKFLTKEAFATAKPLWVQKIYFELVKPLLDGASGGDAANKTNYGVAALVLVKHMDFMIYEDDVEKMLRVAISTAQNLGPGPDTLAALNVLRVILTEASEKAEGHIRSLINICTTNISGQNTSANPDIVAQCGKLALDILGGLPKLFESRHLLSYAPQVDRQLSVACGHRVRDVRSSARKARGAWAEVK